MNAGKRCSLPCFLVYLFPYPVRQSAFLICLQTEAHPLSESRLRYGPSRIIIRKTREEVCYMGSDRKWRKKKMAKHKHRKLLKKTRWKRRERK